MKKILYIIILLVSNITCFGNFNFVLPDTLLQNKPDTIQIKKMEKFISQTDSLPLIIEARKKLLNIYKEKKLLQKWFNTSLELAEDMVDSSFFSAVKILKNVEDTLTTSIKNDTLLSELYKKFGRLYEKYSNFEKAGNYYFKSLKLKRKIKDKKGIASALNSLGLIYYYQGNYDLALKNFSQALDIVEELQFEYGISSVLSNMAIIYLYTNKLDTALSTFLKVLKIEEKLKNKYGISQTLNNLGIIYKKQKKYDKAEKYFNKSLAIKKEIGDEAGEAIIYTNIALIFIEKENYSQAINYLKKAEKIAKKINDKKLLKNIYNDYATVYEKLKDFKNAFEYEAKFVELKDSLFNEEMQQQLLILQTKYETEQKEQQIKLQKAKLAKIEAENKQKELKLEKEKFMRFVFSIGAGILLLILIFIYNNYKQKRQLSEKLARQNQIIQTKNDRLNQLLSEVEKQKIQIEKIHKELSESIDYAKRLQSTILSDFKILKLKIKDFFVLFRPRDKVSGDFYWWAHINNHTIISVADCTGHGVPGAFMSMLGMSLLREIVNKEQVIQPAEILNKLRTEIINTLKQKGITGEQKDGMDMSVITINHISQTVTFAGANNPIYVIDKEELEIITQASINKVKKATLKTNNNYFLYEIKPNKMPIAIYERLENFSEIEFKINQNQQIYLFSDGYADQFGGPNEKKFKTKNLKQLLLDIAHLPMAQQKKKLEKTFDNWKNGYDQIDDVTIVGIKI